MAWSLEIAIFRVSVSNSEDIAICQHLMACYHSPSSQVSEIPAAFRGQMDSDVRTQNIGTHGDHSGPFENVSEIP